MRYIGQLPEQLIINSYNKKGKSYLIIIIIKVLL